MPLNCGLCNEIIHSGSDRACYCIHCIGSSLCRTCRASDRRDYGSSLPPSWFQLIYLTPSGDETETVRCSTVQVSWDEKPEYVYAEFGEPLGSSKSRCIVLDGEACKVSPKLHNVLLELRACCCERIWLAPFCVTDALRTSELLMKELAQRSSHQTCRRNVGVNTCYGRLSGESDSEMMQIDRHNTRDGRLAVRTKPYSAQQHHSFTFVDMRMPLDCKWSEFIVNSKSGRAPNTFVEWATNIEPETEDDWYLVSLTCTSLPNDSSHDQRLASLPSLASKQIIFEFPFYTHHSLPDQDRSIRLLRLKRLGPSLCWLQLPSIDVTTVNIDEAPSYAALSYTWGARHRCVTIACNDTTRLEIGCNLSAALRELYDLDFQYVWVDALCINQVDPQEKSKQISRMTDIYARAAQVIVHLFPRCKSIDCHHLTAIDLINKIASATGKTGDDHEEDLMVRSDLPDHSDRGWAGWAEIRLSEWFTRSWIVQEAVVNHNIQVLICGALLPFQLIENAERNSRRESLSAQFAPVEVAKKTIALITLARERQRLTSPAPLLDFLLDSLRSRASDPRDKIFAFLGLASDRDTAPRPDYTVSPAQTFYNYACHFFHQNPQNGLILIRLAASRWSSLKFPDLPSWVPSWSHISLPLAECDFIGGGFVKGTSHAWSAGGHTRKAPDLQMESRRLVAEGALLGSIVATTSVFDEHIGDAVLEGVAGDPLVTYSDFYQQALEIMNKHPTIYPSFEAAYAATVVADAKYSVVPFRKMEERHQELQDDASVKLRLQTLAAKWYRDCPKSEEQYILHMVAVLEGRRFAVTDSGLMCLIEYDCVPGDVVCIFAGLEAAHVLRPFDGDYRLVGSCYVHGAMSGEMAAESAMQDIRLR